MPGPPFVISDESSFTFTGQTYTTQTGYNARGELTQYTYPDGAVVGRSYTNCGELHQLTHAGTTIDTRVYDNGGRQTASTLNNGVAETRVYGTDNTLTSITFGGSGTAIGNMTYAWDNNHNKTSETITGTMSNYGFTIPTNGYDNEDRLVSFNRTSGLTQSWNLSSVGDWNSVTTNGTAQTRTHGPTHELLTGAGQNVSTDVKGNITAIPSSLRPQASSLTSTWDFDNRMVSADVGSNGSVEVSHQYDALGRRVARTAGGSTTIFVQAGQQTIADYVAGATPASSTYRYVYASYIDEPVIRWQTSNSTALYYHRNQQYSVTALTDSAGAVQERYAYSAYGVPTIANASGTVLTSSAISNRYMYTGREWGNDIQQYHYRARMYDASLGRFCSRDPIGFEGSPQGLYTYVESQPLIGIDPTGLANGRNPGYPKKKPKGPPPHYIPPSVNPVGGGEVWIDFTKTKPRRCIFYTPPSPIAGIDTIPLNGGIMVPFESQKQVTDAIIKNGCCEIVFAGHQASADPGGVKGIFKCNPYDGFGKELSAALNKAGCDGCSLILAACGGTSPESQACRQALSDESGCDVFGSSTIIYYYNPENDSIGKNCTFDKRKFGQKCSTDRNSISEYKHWPFIRYQPGNGTGWCH